MNVIKLLLIGFTAVEYLLCFLLQLFNTVAPVHVFLHDYCYYCEMHGRSNTSNA